MINYTLKNLSQFSGLEEQMIILWNKKFKIFREEKIDKTSSFDQENLKKLITISFLINSNKKFTVEKLSLQTIEELQVIAEFEIQNYIQKNKDYEPLIRLMIVACFSFDSRAFDTILTVCFKKLGIEDCCVKIVFPFLSTMNEILEIHTVRKSIKSFSRNLIRKHLFYLTKSTPYSTQNNRTWLLFLPEKEMHDIELIYAYLVLKLYNEKGIFLGEDQSLQTIGECLENIDITHVITYLNKDYDTDKIVSYLEKIKEIHPSSTIFVATYDKLKAPITDKVPYININDPLMLKSYIDKIITLES